MEYTSHNKVCTTCGEAFVAKRVDARFCSDLCRSQNTYFVRKAKAKGATKATMIIPTFNVGHLFGKEKKVTYGKEEDIQFVQGFFDINGIDKAIARKFIEGYYGIDCADETQLPLLGFTLWQYINRSQNDLSVLEEILAKEFK